MGEVTQEINKLLDDKIKLFDTVVGYMENLVKEFNTIIKLTNDEFINVKVVENLQERNAKALLTKLSVKDFSFKTPSEPPRKRGWFSGKK